MKKEKRKKTNEKGKLLKRSLLAASAVVVIGATTAAAQSSDYFSLFFDQEAKGIVEHQSSNHVSKVVSGIEMAVEETIISGKSALIIVTFEKEDGTAFSSDIVIPTLELDWEQNVGFMVEQKMTEDRKKLIAMFDVDSTTNMDGEKMTITADRLLEEGTDQVIANGPLQISFEASENPTSKHVNTNIQLAQSNETLTLQTIYVSANGIGIEGTYLDGKNDELPDYSPEVIITTLDHNNIELKLGSTSTTESGFKWQYNLDETGERLLLNSDNIKSVMIDGHTIEVSPE
nr:hypothetical protein [Lysinibacillus timonensis]